MKLKLHSDIPITGRDSMESQVFVYHIDHADHIVSVDDNWLEFAHENGAPELTRKTVENRDIWSFITDPDTQLIYRLLFDAVRTKLRPVTISYRCDSPTLRRHMQLTCSPEVNLGIEIRSYIVHAEPRPYSAVLDNTKPRSDAVLTICAWCKQCKVNDYDWREIEEALPQLECFSEAQLPSVSHGMCPDCHLAKLREIRDCVRELNQ